MIKRLNITNYALIDSLEIEFDAGLNIITGETGAGKSIMLSALSLLMGSRADNRAIGHADSKSVVEAAFDVEGNAAMARWAEEADIEWDGQECILRRELLPTGRSRAFINDSPVNLVTLEEAASQLVDIHSQHQNQNLNRHDFQMQAVDALADNAALRQSYKDAYACYRSAADALDRTRKAIEQSRSEQDYLDFQLQQLNAASLQEGEQEELEAERMLQANMSSIKESLGQALDALTWNDSSALPLINRASDALVSLSDVLEGGDELAQRLESACIEIQDIADTLDEFDTNLHSEPRALEMIEDRLSTLYSLQKRFNADSVGALIKKRDEMARRLAEIADADITLSDLQSAVDKAREKAEKCAARLTQSRRNAATILVNEIIEAARPLGMPNLNCVIDVAPAPLGNDGADKVEFLFAFNKNQAPTPLSGAASGGEVSRLMLSLKAVLASHIGLPTVIFDEVDTGVSGDVAQRMGRMMLDMSRTRQVITITHLPQVAALGDVHFKVFKQDDSNATHTHIAILAPEQRRSELALMVSGNENDAAALATADALLSRRTD